MPGYVSMVSGLSAAELEAGGDGATPSAALRPVLRGIGLFVAGFTLVFVALGAAASSIGRLLDAHQIMLAHLSGAVIILLGVVMLLGALPAGVWAHAGTGTLGVVSRVTGEHRFDVRPSKLGAWAAPVMGMAFAFAWTPCIGPVLGVVLGLAARNGSLPGGVLLLFGYSLGLAVPFVLVGLAFGRLTATLGPGPALAVGRRARGRRHPGRLRRALADGQRELGVDAALEPPQRHRSRPALEELAAGHPTGKHSARTSANVRAKVWASPGQRAETYMPSRTTQAGRASVRVSRERPLVLRR